MNNKTFDKLQKTVNDFRFVDLHNVNPKNVDHLFEPPKLDASKENEGHRTNRRYWQQLIEEMKDFQERIDELKTKQNRLKKELLNSMAIYDWSKH